MQYHTAPLVPDFSNTSIPAESIYPYSRIYEMNSDFIGWLTIPSTNIDYPVMLTPSEPEYYLRRAFDKTNSQSGTPFIGEGGNTDSDYFIIYGHNMKNNTMFGSLDSYAEKRFGESNPIFSFDTFFELRKYEFFAAIKTRVFYAEEDEIRYYNYSGVLTKEQYEELTKWFAENAIYDTGIVPVFGEQILILSICSYHTEEGRFVVAARGIE